MLIFEVLPAGSVRHQDDLHEAGRHKNELPEEVQATLARILDHHVTIAPVALILLSSLLLLRDFVDKVVFLEKELHEVLETKSTSRQKL